MPFSSKLLVPAALGLSLVTVTAFVVYYVFKKDEEVKDGAVRTSRANVIEVCVPKSIVPALIGRSGSNIKNIEKKSGALIHFKKFSDKDYDVCIIRGRNENTQLAETLIHDFIKQQPVIEEDNVSVPAWAVGRIIGTGGETINDISHRSGARVKVESLPKSDNITQRNITFRGTKEQIALAKGLVENCIAQEKCRREIEQSKRSPRHVPSPTPTNHDSGPDDIPEAAGSSIEVYVSAVSSPSRFWVQFVGPQVSQLDELVDHMTLYYGKKENRDAHALSTVTAGQVVAAVFRHDGKWYRARVDHIKPNEFDATQQVADVFYLDYGDSEYVATHELCELRADLLRLRFQAMECFLAGVQPAEKEPGEDGGQQWPRWQPQAVERFEELSQVARWKPLVSRTCTYKKTAAIGDKEKEIPGIKLYDVTEEGEVDIGATLIAEGWAVHASPTSPRTSPPPAAPGTPFGDLGNSRVLGMLSPGGARCSSLPKDHKDDRNDNAIDSNENDRLPSSKSLGSGLETTEKPNAVSNLDLSYPQTNEQTDKVNGSQTDFLHTERQNVDKEGSNEALTHPSFPILSKLPRDEFKANMNRIDSHHSSLEALARQHDLHK